MDEALGTLCNGFTRAARTHQSGLVLEDCNNCITKLGAVISYVIDKLEGTELVIEHSVHGALTIAQRSVR